MADLLERHRDIRPDGTHTAPSWPVAYRLAAQYIDSLPEDALVTIPNTGSAQAFNGKYVEEIATELLEFVAYVVSIGINAGSERDAVNENERLWEALADELGSWAMPLVSAATITTERQQRDS